MHVIRNSISILLMFLSLNMNCYWRIPSVDMGYVGCMSVMAFVF